MRIQLEDRTVSAFAISIGTGNALRTLFTATSEVYNDEPHLHNMVPLNTINTIAVSWYTIIRNIISATDKETKKMLLSGKGTNDVVAVALNEIQIINGLVADAGLQFRLIAPNYNNVSDHFLMKDAPIELIKIFQLAKSTIKKINVDYESNHKFNIGSNAMLISHINFDMLNTKNKGLRILESHTGNVLNSSMFNKKYRVKEDTSFLPFYSNLLFILGDHCGLLASFPAKVKRETLDALSKARVHPKTSYNKIQTILTRNNYVQDYIKRFRDPYR